MEFGFRPDELAFADEVREFLRTHPPARYPHDGMDAGYGSGAHSHAFLRELAAQGWLSMTWPRAFGGAERPMMHKLVLLEELGKAGAPFGPLANCWTTADAIIAYGSPYLKAEVLPRIARGEATFWQGFSEPDSGSDLLSLKTTARRDGDDYVIDGHKIWSSHAGISTYGLVLARTRQSARRSHGLSMFVVDSTTPGLTIRPIRSLTGEVYHHEIFLDSVRVPAEVLLGKEDEGFVELLRGLDTDRFWGRFYKPIMLKRILAGLVDYANAAMRDGAALARDGHVRRRLATFAAELEALRLLFYRVAWMLERKMPVTYESALVKVWGDETGQKVAAFGLELLGLFGPLTAASPWAMLGGEIQHVYQTSMGQTIAGGTSEILRSTIATRGLGLPAEPKVVAR
jgi:3-oxocholest-4-en-26-oyl-CoA dehydrogenase alpha subunit